VRPERLRIAVSTKPIQPAPVDPEVKRAVTETAEVMRAHGHDVRERDPSWGLMLPAFLPRYLAGIRADALRMPHRERLEQRTKRLVRWARLLDGRPLRRALAAEQKHLSRLGALFDEFDVLMTPTLAKLPERAGRWLGMSAIRTVNDVARFVPFTTAWNVTGQPAASVPAGLARDGLPLAVQLVGRPGDETTLISLAAQLESERPWARHKPPTS
jgi:amidase